MRLFKPELLHAPRSLWVPDAAVWANQPMLEIGAGMGKHAMAFAANNPHTPIIAIERTRLKFNAFAKRLAGHTPLPSCYAVHADAIAWTVYAVPAAALAQVFILYPNPEPHNPNQRWLNMPFFGYLLSRLAAGGSIVLASNVASYIDEAVERCQKTWQLAFSLANVADLHEPARSHFEAKYLQRGEHCQQITMHKPQGYVSAYDHIQPRLKGAH